LLALATVALVLIAARAAAFAALFSNHAGILLTQDEIAAAARTANATREQVVPRIIHQIFHNWKKPGHDDEIPTDWALRRKSCVDLHPDWDVKVRSAVTNLADGWIRPSRGGGGADCRDSSGRKRRRETLSQQSIRPFWRRTTVIGFLCSALMRCDIS
jgi:hypothetical protein